MGLFGNKKPENENISGTQNTPADQHIINEVESVAKTEGAGGGTVERLSSNSEELRRLLNEFKAMQGDSVQNSDYSNQSNDTSQTEEYSEERHSVEEGEKYTLSAEENNQIEKYLVGEEDEVEADEYMPVEEAEEPEFVEISDDDDVIYIDEMADDGEAEEEYLEEEPVEAVKEYYDDSDDELVEEEYSTDDIQEEVVEEYLDETPTEEYVEEYVDEGSDEEIVDEEEIEDEEIIDEDEVVDEEYDDGLYVEEPSEGQQEYVEDEVVEDVEEYYDDEVSGVEEDVEDTEEIIEDFVDEESEEVFEDDEEQDLDDDEEVIIEDYSDDVDDNAVEGTLAPAMSEEDIDKKLDAKLSAFEEQLITKLMATMNMANQNNVQTSVNAVSAPVSVDENIEAEDLHFEGQVVIFEPIEKIKQATWEDVVRRKGHYTYHVTASSNGGWFIKRAKSPNPYAYLENKEEAMKLAIVYAKREKAELKVHNEKGVIETSMSFGREKKIN